MNFKETFIKSFHKAEFWTKKNSPTILLVAGIAGAAASVILACKETPKAQKVTKQTCEKLKEIKTKLKDDNLLANKEYSVEEGKKEITKTYFKFVGGVTKAYLPCVAVFSLSVAAILTSHKILKGRNLALVAAYSAVDNAYRSYRERVKARFGEEVENEIYKNIYSEKKIVKKTNKKGEVVDVEEEVMCAHPSEDDIYNFCYDASCDGWTKDGASNITYLLYVQRSLNNKLMTQGYLFLKDVYDALGVEDGWLTERQMLASRVVGWIYDEKDPTRDSFVSFGISDKYGNLNSTAMELRRNNEKNIWLEFNPDGDILTDNNKNFTQYVKHY